MLFIYKTKIQNIIILNKKLVLKKQKNISFKNNKLILSLFSFNKFVLTNNLIDLFSFYMHTLIGLIRVSISNFILKKSYPLTLNRSPFVNKKAKDQFEFRTNKINLTLFFYNEQSLKNFKNKILFLKYENKILYRICSKSLIL
jgi:ribosomal protein S10